jgi:hypothetical protein
VGGIDEINSALKRAAQPGDFLMFTFSRRHSVLNDHLNTSGGIRSIQVGRDLLSRSGRSGGQRYGKAKRGGASGTCATKDGQGLED